MDKISKIFIVIYLVALYALHFAFLYKTYNELNSDGFLGWFFSTVFLTGLIFIYLGNKFRKKEKD